MEDRTDQDPIKVGFIGLGVMGEPMCRHILQKQLGSLVSEVIGFDLASGPMERLAEVGLRSAASAREIVETCDLILFSLPGDEQVDALWRGKDGLLDAARSGQTIVDLGTTSLRLTRELADAFSQRAIAYADAPVARTRSAAESGTLAVLVGGEPATFRPSARCWTVLPKR